MAAAKKIVSKDFFCVETKVEWKRGQEYDGKRENIDHVLMSKEDFDKEEAERKAHNAKINKAEKKRQDELAGTHGIPAKEKKKK